MENKQTGWVPDFPDVKDYTLKSKQIHKALQPIQAAQVIGSLESQKESVLELLQKIVATTKKHNPEAEEVEKLYQKLQQGMGNEVCLVEAKLLEPDQQSYKSHTDKLAELLDIERIPSKVFDIIVEKFFKESGSGLLRLKEEEKDSRLTKVVYPIVKVIAQILTPIGEHVNLPKAVINKGIKYFKNLLQLQSNDPLKPQSNDTLEKTLEFLIQEIKELKKATEINPNFSTSSFQAINSWKSENKYFEYLACSAMLKAKEELIAMETSLDQTEDKEIKNILNKVKKDLEVDFENALEAVDLPFKKALEFDGKDYLYQESSEWKPDGDLTIEFWVKVNKDNFKSGSSFDFESKSDSKDLFYVTLSSDLYLRWEDDKNCWVAADYSPYLNQWTHVALVSETLNKVEHTYIYLNGELVDKSHVDVSQRGPNQYELKITNSWKAEIARFRIWKQAWTPDDIRKNMFLREDSEENLTNSWYRVTNDDIVNDENNPNNTSVPSGDTKPKIVTIESESSLSKKWMIKEDKKKSFEGLVSENQTRFNILPPQPPQEDTDYSEEKDKTNCLQFIILKKHLNKITATDLKDANSEAKRLVGLVILPDFIDLSLWCSEIEDQGSLNSCTASAAIALMEYFQKKSFGKYIDGSRLFLYKATRNLMQIEGNVGTSIRNTMKAMALFGVPPEEYWPYDEAKVNVEPNPFCYAFAQSYQALKYFRLDPAGITNKVLLAQIKAILVSGFPCVFGFTLYSSIYDESNPRGHIPYPHQRDKAEGGHSVVAVGYDDYKVIKNADDDETTGALLIRNSWGSRWGEGGYGWLPYEYVLRGLTADWWSLLSSEWFDTEQFGLGGGDWTDNVGNRDVSAPASKQTKVNSARPG